MSASGQSGSESNGTFQSSQRSSGRRQRRSSPSVTRLPRPRALRLASSFVRRTPRTSSPTSDSASFSAASLSSSTGSHLTKMGSSATFCAMLPKVTCGTVLYSNPPPSMLLEPSAVL